MLNDFDQEAGTPPTDAPNGLKRSRLAKAVPRNKTGRRQVRTFNTSSSRGTFAHTLQTARREGLRPSPRRDIADSKLPSRVMHADFEG